MSTIELLVFGDQTLNVQPYLTDLTRHRGNPVLEDFLVKTYLAIRNEIDRLGYGQRAQFPRLTCIDDIIFPPPGGRQCVALEMATTCLYQLSVFISQRPGHLDSDKTCVMGVCTGALAAAAVSCSRSTLELVPIAVDAVIVAFKTGLRVMDVANRLAPDEDGRSWLLHIPTIDSVEEALRNFHSTSSLSELQKPYISAYTPSSVSVSGPPASLRQLCNDAAFREIRPQTAPIYGPYHASHLYTSDDVDEIVGTLGDHDQQYPRRAFLVSTDGTRIEGADFNSILKAAVSQILLRPMSWPQTLDEVLRYFESREATALSLATIGAASDQFIYRVLSQTPLGKYLTSQNPAVRLGETVNGGDTRRIRPKLAIVGMSGRFPGAEDNEEYWKLLFSGLDVHKPVPSSRWNAETHVDPTGKRKNTSTTPFGCWLDQPELFDAQFFNISPREAPQIDPAQRLALMTAYEAIEQAGIVPDATPSTRRDRVGVFFGSTANDWMETNSAQDIDTYFIPGGNRAFIPGRINYYFRFSGPSYAVDTACSSSLASIHLACNALWLGEIDTAIAGGSNVLTNPDFTAGLDRGHFLSRTGNCRTFDDSADGYCRGEGVATVIIKRLEDAIADKDPVLGVILSASTNHSAEAVSITRPHMGAQRDILRNLLNRGATQPHEIDYVEMHGTGTQHGDATEMNSVLESFAPSPKAGQLSKRSDRPLYLGSAKANIGHGEAASGVSSLVKVLLMLQRDTIVPHCGIKTKVSSKFPTDFTERNAHIAFEPTPWNRSSEPSRPRKVVVNNFSAAGGNSAILLEDAPLPSNAAIGLPDPRTHHLVAVSAKHSKSLLGNIRSLLQYLERNPDVSLAKLSYTTTARRIHHQFRVMASGININDVQKELRAALERNTTRQKSAPKIFFAFTGQGAHFTGMGRELYDNFTVFSSEFCRLNRLGQSMGFANALPAIQCDNDDDFSTLGPVAIQLAGVYIQMALCKLWSSWNITPDAVVGHSLGEYPAMAAAGILSDADAVYLVGKRAQLVHERCKAGTHSMLVIRGSVNEIKSSLDKRAARYEVSCVNSPTETVIAGPNEHLQVLKRLLQEDGLKSTMLKVPYAFHSMQMDPILEPLEKVTSALSFLDPKISFLSSVDAKFMDSADGFDVEYMTRHTRNKVNMQDALITAQREGHFTDQTVVIEIGPHAALLPMFKANVGSQVTCFASASRGRSNFQVLAESLKGLYLKRADISWSEYHRDFASSHEVLPLPAYSWDLKPYWMQYVHDWSLRKGDAPLMISNAMSALESTTIHRVVEEVQNGSKTKIIVEANIARKDLSPLVQGHEVDGIPLCTPSVYGDMALTLGRYLQKKYRPGQKADLVDVGDMTISKALILRAGATEQRLQAHAEADFDSNTVIMVFKSFDAREKLQEHARCKIQFRERSLLQQLERDASLVQDKVRTLRDGIVSGQSARFNRAMVYRAIRPLARFHDDYRAIDEILLNSNTLEAACRLSFGTVKREGVYHTHPAVIDALTQSCGFTMNCNDLTDLDKEVYMNHGWGSFQIFEPIDMDKSYVTYTQMSEGADKLWRGDVVIFQGNKVVAFFGQIAIQGVPRRVLKTILSIEAGTRQSNQQSKPIAPKQELNGNGHIKVPSPIGNHVASPSTPMKQPTSGGGKFTQALSIIAEESGLALSDFDDSTGFADVGIDSLMSLTISARLKDDLDVDLDMSALVTDYPTVGELRAYMEGSSGPVLVDGPAPSYPSVNGHSTPVAHPIANGTPVGISSSGTSSNGNFMLQQALKIISEESGIAQEDLTDDTEFSDAGVDSLLFLVIFSRLRDELELDVQSDSFLNECSNVAELKRFLLGDEAVAIQKGDIIPAPSVGSTHASAPPLHEPQNEILASRKKAVDELVQKYTEGFGETTVNGFLSDDLLVDDAKVVMVTGASGNLGSHFVHQLAARPDVKLVICLNRLKNSIEPYAHQAKAMRDKGLRNFEELRPKLLVLQTDTTQPLLGLPKEQYHKLVSTVTHLIHNAWPMSAKRQLDGFESQFQVMRNLLDFAHNVIIRRPEPFKFSFTQVSSIGVVGFHRLAEYKTIGHMKVPEDRVGIDSVLPNGYSEAKWGMERMLDGTLHKYKPHRFRASVARCGQIAGGRTHFYWPPTEHFAFLVKSSQTLGALPDAPGKLYWTPVEDVAGSIIDVSLSNSNPYPVYHIDSPCGQSWSHMNQVLAKELGISKLVPFEVWVDMVRKAPARDNPAATLSDFFDDNYLRMSCGGLTLDVSHTLEHSKVLRAVGPVSDDIVKKYLLVWREIGFLKVK